MVIPMAERPKLWSREFHWVSSVNGDVAALAALDRAMASFYSQLASRREYQAMVDADDSAQPQTEEAMRRAILARKPGSVLEVGCGSARTYQRLRAEGLTGAYTGLELSPEVISQNEERFPEARWICGSIYDTALPAGSFDAVYAYFVLEHCVYPSRAVERMVGLLRANGALTLVFPDCAEMGRLGSQALGFVRGRALDRLRRGDIFNALFNLYESRWRLPHALRRVVEDYGPFPVNLNPRCLVDSDSMEPDVDQVYISSKKEIGQWAASNALRVEYPAGVEGNFRDNALMQLIRPAR
jgi:SAM-dependent methyltransferase